MDENILIIEEPKEKEIVLEKENIVFKESLRAEDILFDDGESLQVKFENGELKGEPGEQGEKGESFVYSDFTEEQLEALTGPQGPVGPQGDDYILTNADKQEIAQLVLNELPNAEGVEY